MNTSIYLIVAALTLFAILISSIVFGTWRGSHKFLTASLQNKAKNRSRTILSLIVLFSVLLIIGMDEENLPFLQNVEVITKLIIISIVTIIISYILFHVGKQWIRTKRRAKQRLYN